MTGVTQCYNKGCGQKYYTTIRQHCIIIAAHNTAHTQGERPTQLPSTLGAQEMHQTQQELIKRQGNKPEKSYIELTPGTPVWVQHRQNATWEPATVVSQWEEWPLCGCCSHTFHQRKPSCICDFCDNLLSANGYSQAN